MGSGTSKSPEDKAQEVRHKLAIVNAMDNRKVKPKVDTEPAKRSDVYDFVRKRKEEKRTGWTDLQQEYAEGKEEGTGRVNHGESAKEKQKRLEQDPLYRVPDEPEVDPKCSLCGKMTLYRIDGYMCRVCGLVFHKPCLEKTGRFTPAELLMVDRAFTNTGWSCHECDNITSLLSTDESCKISDTFEEFDIDKDCNVSIEEYLAYRRKQYQRLEGKPMPKEEDEFETFQFTQLDADGSGIVDYWEFMKHEATKVLYRRDKTELTGLLTAREKRAARMVYDHFDTDKDGTIDALEARMAFRAWYSFADQLTKKNSDPEAPTIASHVIQNTAIDLADDADEDDDAFISWPEFLRNQSIYILSSRPNKAKLPQSS